MTNSKPKTPRSSNVETLGPVSRKKFRIKPKTLIPLASLFLIVSLAGGVYAVKYDNDKGQNSQSVLPQQETQNADTVKAEQAKQAELAAEKEALAEEAKPKRPVVVFVPDGVFSEEEKQELKDKLIDPMIDYRPEAFMSVIIEIYSQDKFVGGVGDDKYIVTTIGREDGGTYGGFLYGSKKKGLDYWVPECLDGCQFTEEYKKKYPEVVKEYGR